MSEMKQEPLYDTEINGMVFRGDSIPEVGMERVSVPALDEILGVPYKVLDKGFVRCVDYMGGDESIVQAARVSYGKGTKKLSEDEGLIRYLQRHWHTTPTEMCEIKFHVRVPMDCWRQWIRHRMASVNEYSTRYSEAIDDRQCTAPDEWRLQSGVNKQGSSGVVSEWSSAEQKQLHLLRSNPMEDFTPGQWLTQRERDFHLEAATLYEERLALGVAKEVARKDLPLSTYTEAYWKIDLHNLLHFLSLRMDSHAQLEIRSYANVIGDIVAKWVPLTWAAFNDYHPRRNTIVLTARDKAILRAVHTRTSTSASGCSEEIDALATSFGWLEKDEKTGKLKSNRERQECEAKLHALYVKIPWDWGTPI